ncbi:MAG TPA: hypothetical protein VGP05_14835 [Pseudonocardia sp.]|jgi:acyl dehydratase|nr:hypothetical protein [Pseudonocardia sp.]
MVVRQGWQGRFYEDFEAGDVYQHPLGRTITETDNTWFTLLTMNTNQAHFNAQVGASSEFGRMLVASPLTIRTRTLNQDAVEVLTFKRTFYVHRRGAERAASLFPVAAAPLSLDNG